jgi:Glycosyl hydrolase family 65, N-terminal domain
MPRCRSHARSSIDSESQGEVRNYARSVDFQTAEAVVRWSDDRGAFERHMFVSPKDGVTVIQWTAPRPGTLSVKLKLEPREPSDEFNNALDDGLPGQIDRSPQLRGAFTSEVEDQHERYWKDNERGFMSFGIVRLGQASASLGHGDTAHQCLKHLAYGFWLNNLASMHNRRALFIINTSERMLDMPAGQRIRLAINPK